MGHLDSTSCLPLPLKLSFSIASLFFFFKARFMNQKWLSSQQNRLCVKKKKKSSFNLIFYKQETLNSYLNEFVTTPPLAHFLIVTVSNEFSSLIVVMFGMQIGIFLYLI